VGGDGRGGKPAHGWQVLPMAAVAVLSASSARA
jgi:hypothetical protein